MNLKINWSGKSHNYSFSEKKYLTNVLDSDALTQGPQKEKFEKSLSSYLKVKNIFCTSSAASALEIISDLLNLKKGDEIIIPAHTYCASAIPFARRGAKIIWADIDLKTSFLPVGIVISVPLCVVILFVAILPVCVPVVLPVTSPVKLPARVLLTVILPEPVLVAIVSTLIVDILCYLCHPHLCTILVNISSYSHITGHRQKIICTHLKHL